MIEELLICAAIVLVIVWVLAWNRQASLKHAIAMNSIHQHTNDLRTGAANRKRVNKPGDLTFEQICNEWEGVSQGNAVAFPIENALDWCIAEIHRLQGTEAPVDEEITQLMNEADFNDDIDAREAIQTRRQFLAQSSGRVIRGRFS